jgi:hypothetical protein
VKGRGIFIQRPVRPDFVVIASISLQDPTQARLAQGDEVIEAVLSENYIRTYW